MTTVSQTSKRRMWAVSLALVISGGAASGLHAQQGEAPIPYPADWVAFRAVQIIEPLGSDTSAVRRGTYVRDKYGSVRTETGSGDTLEIRLRNIPLHMIYIKKGRDQWLATPFLEQAKAPTEASLQRPGLSLTETTYEGMPALKVTRVGDPNLRIVVPGLTYFPVDGITGNARMRLVDIVVEDQPPALFKPPAGEPVRFFRTREELEAFLQTR
jgi:hypothetical protein